MFPNVTIDLSVLDLTLPVFLESSGERIQEQCNAARQRSQESDEKN
jgi:hypothetical protein